MKKAIQIVEEEINLLKIELQEHLDSAVNLGAGITEYVEFHGETLIIQAGIKVLERVKEKLGNSNGGI